MQPREVEGVTQVVDVDVAEHGLLEDHVLLGPLQRSHPLLHINKRVGVARRTEFLAEEVACCRHHRGAVVGCLREGRANQVSVLKHRGPRIGAIGPEGLERNGVAVAWAFVLGVVEPHALTGSLRMREQVVAVVLLEERRLGGELALVERLALDGELVWLQLARVVENAETILQRRWRGENLKLLRVCWKGH